MLEKQLNLYRSCHQKMFTKITHLFGVPLIIFGLFTILNWLELTVHGVGSWPVTWLAIVFLVIYYCLFDWQLALIAGAWMLALALISFFWVGVIPSIKGFYVFLTCFFVGWVFQLIGHIFERRKPALIDNFWQIFSAPIFITLEVANWCGFKENLLRQINEG